MLQTWNKALRDFKCKKGGLCFVGAVFGLETILGFHNRCGPGSSSFYRSLETSLQPGKYQLWDYVSHVTLHHAQRGGEGISGCCKSNGQHKKTQHLNMLHLMLDIANILEFFRS